MKPEELELTLEPAEDFSSDQWEEMLVRARRDLQDSGIPFSSTRGSRPAPEGAKSGFETWVPATLLVSTTPLILRALSGCLETWLKNRIVRNIRIKVGDTELELSDATRDQQLEVLQIVRDALQKHE